MVLTDLELYNAEVMENAFPFTPTSHLIQKPDLLEELFTDTKIVMNTNYEKYPFMLLLSIFYYPHVLQTKKCVALELQKRHYIWYNKDKTWIKPVEEISLTKDKDSKDSSSSSTGKDTTITASFYYIEKDLSKSTKRMTISQSLLE